MHQLCYVEGMTAYFTNRPLTGEGRQWGNDWGKAPFEHNCGAPHVDELGQIVEVLFRSKLCRCDESHVNSPWSVEMINEGATPWLWDVYGRSGPYVYAGIGPDEFRRIIKQAGGRVGRWDG